MQNLEGLSKHHSVITAAEVDEICKPLYKIGITFFLYGKIFPDNKRIFLSNNPTWNEYYLINFYKLLYPDNYWFEQTAEQMLLLTPELFPYNAAFRDAREVANLKNGIFLPFISTDYREAYYFGSKKEDLLFQNIYLTNLDILYQFITYFKEKAHNLIKHAEKSKLDIPVEYLNHPSANILNQCEIDTHTKAGLLVDLQTNKYYLKRNPNYYLTSKEYNCIKWLVIGKSAEEIGILTNLSKRTVESYLNNVKIKFGCIKTSQLIYKLAKLGLEIT